MRAGIGATEKDGKCDRKNQVTLDSFWTSSHKRTLHYGTGEESSGQAITVAAAVPPVKLGRQAADALNAVQRGDVLVVATRDRIARDAFLALLVERAVAKKGARIVSAAGEGTESDDPTAIFMRRLLDAVSELERSLIAARTRAAMRGEETRTRRVASLWPHLILHDEERHTLRLLRRLRALGLTQPTN